VKISWTARAVSTLVGLGGAVTIAACSGAPAENAGASAESAFNTCPAGQEPHCTDETLHSKLLCWCDTAVENDVCTASVTPPAGSWLERAGCVSLTGTTVRAVPAKVVVGASAPTLWTCTNLAAVPAEPVIFGNDLHPCPVAPHVAACGAYEHVGIIIPGGSQPACVSPATGVCSAKSLNSSCYPDPAPGQFIVEQWYSYVTGANPGPCGGAACCTALCGLNG
jgi:hypothetical protein